MKLLIILLTLALSLSGQFVPDTYCLSGKATGAQYLTVQQPTDDPTTRKFTSVWLQCDDGCNGFLYRNSPNPTTTLTTITKAGQGIPATDALGYTASNAGTGTLIMDYVVVAGGVGTLVDLSGWTITGLDVSVSHASTDAAFVSIVDAVNLATVTITAHGKATGDLVVVRGVTTDLQLNDSFTITVTGADTFTFVTALVTDGTYNGASDAGMTLVTEGVNFTAGVDVAGNDSRVMLCFTE